ncbi:MAG: double-strand break repair helicase AddA [Magnetospiraceae bacterium]
MSGTDKQTVDASAAQRRASDPAVSAWVTASAGTGKTKVLTDRVLSLLVTGTAPARILCLTFTKAAAAEMANRVSEELAKWARADEDTLEKSLFDLLDAPPDAARRRRARGLFARVLETPGGLQIMTIHAFCQSLLRRFPLEAGVSPHFAVMEERDAADLLAGVLDAVLRQAPTDSLLSGALAAVTARVGEEDFLGLMGEVMAARGRLGRLIARHGGQVETLIAATRERLGLGDMTDEAAVIAAACADARLDLLGLRFAVSALTTGTKTDQAQAARMGDWLAQAPDRRAQTFDDYTSCFLTQAQAPRAKLITKKPAENYPGAADILAAEQARILAVAEQRRAARTFSATAGLLRLAGAMIAAYNRHKTARAAMDFDDLILHAKALLTRDLVSWVLYKLDGGIDHVLIDEAQDSNADQWAVVEALAAEYFAGVGTGEAPRTVFAVGDVKQSIYSFQGAQPGEFGRLRGLFDQKAKDAGQTLHPVSLGVNFRSTPAVLDAVTAVFSRPEAAAGVITGDDSAAHYPWRQNQAGLVEVWPVVAPREADPAPAWKPPVERIRLDSPPTRLARLVAGRIARMTGAAGDELATFLPAKGRNAHAGDIMVLVRRRSGFVVDLVRELKSLDIPVAGADRMMLTSQIAVMDLIALGRFLLLPTDDLTLATVLKSPLVGLTEDQLFTLAYDRQGSLWAALSAKQGLNPTFAATHALLSRLLARADFVTPYALFAGVLTAEGGWRRILARLGPEAEDPIQEFLDQALAYERSHAPSLEGFLHWMELGAVEVKRDLDQGAGDAVRVMTVHGAKGLQAPIVFLPDTLQIPAQGPRLLWPGAEQDGAEPDFLLWPPRTADLEAIGSAARDAWKAAQEAEYRRLLYVAMTRAEDQLIICGARGSREPPEGCWYNLVTRGLGGIAASVADSWLAEAGETDSSDVLQLVSQQETPVTAPPPPTTAEVPPLPAWSTAPPPPEPTPPRPLIPSRQGDDPPARSPLGPDGTALFQRGTLVHRMLQSLPALPARDREPAALAWLARSAGTLPEAARQDLVTETLAVLSHPDFAALFGQGSRAEVPLVGRVGPHIVSGQVDRLVVTATEVMIVDYKTNRPPPRNVADVAPLYLRQMALYRDLLADIYPGKPRHCVLLWTDGPFAMRLPDTLLDAAVT